MKQNHDQQATSQISAYLDVLNEKGDPNSPDAIKER